MKLSEAMMLGDVLRVRTNKLYLCVLDTAIGNSASVLGVDPSTPEGTVCGCALGGAFYAATGKTIYDRNFWPWLRESPKTGILDWEVLIGCGISNDISFLRVMRGEATFEQLVDYVRSIEPECDECNRFDCQCDKAPFPEDVTMAVSV